MMKLRVKDDKVREAIPQAIEKVKEDKVTEKSIIKLYGIFKRHQLSLDEVRWARNIANRIKSGELTEDMLYEKAKNWLATQGDDKKINNLGGIE